VFKLQQMIGDWINRFLEKGWQKNADRQFQNKGK